MEDPEASERALTDALAATSIVVPAYDEAAVIGDVLLGLEGLPCTVIVVDDGSTDDTQAVCLRHPVAVLRHGTNLGQGAALQTGITYALRETRARFVVTFDADGQHSAMDITRLIERLVGGDYDVALGTRFARRSDAQAIPRARRALLRCAVVFTRVTTGLAVTDTHNGLRAFSAAAARQLAIRHSGMTHASEILATIRRRRLRWCEVPVTVRYTEYSRAKGQRGTAAVDVVWDLLTSRLR